MDVCVWRADARNAIWEGTRVAAPKTGAKDESLDKKRDCDWTTASFEKLKKLIRVQLPKGALPFAKSQELDPKKALEGEDEMAKVWADHERSSPTQAVYEKSLAKQWRATGCAPEGAPYVLRALLNRLDDSSAISPFAEKPTLAAAFLDKDCAGARELSEAEIAKLQAIRNRAPPSAPKP